MMSSSNLSEQHEQPADGIRRRHPVELVSSHSLTSEMPEALINYNFQEASNGVSTSQHNFTTGSPLIDQGHSINNQFFGSDLPSLWYGNTLNQFMWNHQMYTDYMNQYMQYMESLGQQNSAPVEQAQVENILPQNNQQGPQLQQAQVMNAQGGAFLLEDEEDDRNRDWLDWAYVILRFIMLMCILYFYSTPVRFVTFIIASVVFFIYQAGWLAVPPMRRPNENAEPQEQAAAEIENRNMNGPLRVIPQFVSTLWSIVVCFFVSLAPQVPPPINAN